MNKRLLLVALASAAALSLSLPAIGQDAPESLLPPGFGSPQRAPASEPNNPTPVPLLPTEGFATSDDQTLDNGSATEDADAAKDEPIELPDAARRTIDIAGPLTPENGGLGAAAFGRADGRFLARLMHRLDAPVASRWGSILLRRALLSQVPTPVAIAPADWIAERAWLLLRMGEADGARMLVDNVDVDRFGPKLLIVAQQVALATGDPAALCPLTTTAARFNGDKSWDYARAICAALSGEGAASSMLLDHARGGSPRSIDYLLAEKIVGAGTNTRHAAVIEWDDVDQLTVWRFGLASAAGVEIPERLLAIAPPSLQAWRARAPMYHPEDRIGAARIAATLGVFSNAALIDLYGQIGDREGDVGRDAPAARLRTAYIGDDAAARMAAIRSFWTESDEQPGGLYGAEILTARAAAMLAPDPGFAADYTRLIAAMLSAGLDIQATRWAPLVQASSPSIADPAWAMLAVGAPRRVVDLGYARIDGYGTRLGAAGTHKMQLLIAGLGGLGRLSARDEAALAQRYALSIASQTPYTRAIDRAAARGEQGTVALLAAIGMQTDNWRKVPPLHLYHIVAALRRTGNEPVARMIAAEAMSRS